MEFIFCDQNYITMYRYPIIYINAYICQDYYSTGTGQRIAYLFIYWGGTYINVS